MSNTATLSATWNPKGKQPQIACKQVKKERVTGFGSINPVTGQLIANFAQTGYAGTFKRHLRKVLKVCKGKLSIPQR